MLPGNEVINNKADVIDLIRVKRNPKSLPPLDVLRLAKHVGTEIFDSDIFCNNKLYYVWYEHPVLKKFDKLYLTSKEELIKFLYANIRPEREEGLDITVTPHDDLAFFLMCNHDGEIYLILNSKPNTTY